MSCECNKYKPLELQQKDIYKRIKESKTLKKQFKFIAKHKNGEEKLYQCEKCGQLWQGSYYWNGKGEYLFKVPFKEIELWQKSHYSAPDEILRYLVVMQQFLETNKFETKNELCSEENCSNKSLKFGQLCFVHHIICLKNIGSLPDKPNGVLFSPYEEVFIKYQSIFEKNISKYL